MAVSEIVIRPFQNDSNSKSAKKKKATKALATENSSISATLEPSQSNGVSHNNIGDGSLENPHIRDLQKNIRNINKKIANASKVDNVIAENPDKTLDELVAARKINADQKAQVLKKPALQASLAQLENQVAQYIKLDAEFKTRFQNEKEALEKNLKELAKKELEQSLALAESKAQESSRIQLEESLLLLSQFLKLAAIRRADEEAAELEESKALEGLLAQVYSGDTSAVAAMLNLIHGSNETLKSVTGEDLNVNYATLKEASMAQVLYINNEDQVDEQELVKNEHTDSSDPTTTDVCLTEMNSAINSTLKNEQNISYQAQEISQPPEISSNESNIVAETSWDMENDLSQSQEWVEVPSNTQKDVDVYSSTAGATKAQSWADDQPDIAPKTSIPVNSVSDGFQEIQRNRGGRGNRGGRPDGYRSRGSYRGDGYRGRGRGGGGHRGGRRSDD